MAISTVSQLRKVSINANKSISLRIRVALRLRQVPRRRVALKSYLDTFRRSNAWMRTVLILRGNKKDLHAMDLSQYLFGFEFHSLCIHCPGAEWSIVRRCYGLPLTVRQIRCPLCAPQMTGKFYTRWV